MTLIDSRGRLFGRFNLVDLSIAAFVLAVLPLAYGAVRLFRPATPHIASVTQVPVGKEEWRIAGTTVVKAKLKLKGSGFNPLLRVMIGRTPALAFVFEDPNSADVIVGSMPAGRHDVVLLDGVQEVARLPGAVTFEPESAGVMVRLEGWLTGLDPEEAAAFREGAGFPADARAYQIVAMGPARTAGDRVALRDGVVDLPRVGRVDRRTLIEATCDPREDAEPCRVLGQSIAQTFTPPDSSNRDRALGLPGPTGPVRFVVTDVFPSVPPRRAQVQVRLVGGAEIGRVAVGDRDALLDTRAATVTTVGARGGAGGDRAMTVTLALGLDDSRDGWRYRGQLVTPGSELALRADGYHVRGFVQAFEWLETPKPQ